MKRWIVPLLLATLLDTASAQEDQGEETLPAAATSGQVTDIMGTPIVGVRIVVKTVGQDSPPPREITSGEEGAFALGDLEPERAYQLTVSMAGFATAELTIEDPAASTNIVIRLEKARSIRGRVLDITGKPLGDVEVRASFTSGDVTARTDATGWFELQELPVFKIDLEAKKEGYAPLKLRGITIARAKGPRGQGPMKIGVLKMRPVQ